MADPNVSCPVCAAMYRPNREPASAGRPVEVVPYDAEPAAVRAALERLGEAGGTIVFTDQ